VECLLCPGICLDVSHRLGPISDDLTPSRRRRASADRPRYTAQAVVVLGGLALAGGAAYGVVPGEMGRHGAQVVNIAAPSDAPSSQLYARAAEGAVGGHPGGGAGAPDVVYVNGRSPSEGPSIVSVAHPSRDVAVLAMRGLDGQCTFLRVSPDATRDARKAVAWCSADEAPAHGWTPYGP
jgi:hypothetical protein